MHRKRVELAICVESTERERGNQTWSSASNVKESDRGTAMTVSHITSEVQNGSVSVQNGSLLRASL